MQKDLLAGVRDIKMHDLLVRWHRLFPQECSSNSENGFFGLYLGGVGTFSGYEANYFVQRQMATVQASTELCLKLRRLPYSIQYHRDIEGEHCICQVVDVAVDAIDSHMAIAVLSAYLDYMQGGSH